MKAILQHHYGPPEEVLVYSDAPEPEVLPDEVRVRVRAASVHPDLWHAVTGRPYILRAMGSGLFRPKNPVPGIDQVCEALRYLQAGQPLGKVVLAVPGAAQTESRPQPEVVS